jgi:cell division protein FtsI/penicillin-binding protein 2
MGSRFTFLAVAVVAVYGFLFFHLFDLQVLDNQEYRAAAESQYAASLGLPSASRGSIYFTDGNGKRLPAAINKDFPVIYAVPSVIEDPAATAAQASLILGQPAKTLEAQFSKKSSKYVLLNKNPDAEMVAKVSESKIKGLYTESIPRRFYPFGPMASQVLGFVGPNKDDNGVSGKYGAEKFYNDELLRRTDVTLTIDPTIQAQGEHLIQTMLVKWRGKKASMMVEDVKTGRILAMGSYPSFDPNSYASTTNISRFLNPLIQDSYEPGSVMKIITMAAALDSKKITPNTTYTDTGELKLDGRTVRNWDLKAHGTVTMTEVIEGSLNTGAAFAQQRTGNTAFRGYLEKFGFNEKTGIELPGELSGDLRQLVPGKPQINFATASFGQGVAVTPIEMLQSIAAIANDGVLMRPYLDASDSPQEVRRVISEDAAKQATGMMVAAVDTAKVASIPGFSIAGKTGTAQIAARGGYGKDVIDTYIGFVPASDPKFIIFLKLDEALGAPHAAETVVPVFREFAQFLINYYHIAPDRIAK